METLRRIRIPAALDPRRPTTVAVWALLIAAFALRVYGWNWDDGRYLHPDERHVVMIAIDRITLTWPPDLDNLFDPAVSTLNPRSDDPDPERPNQPRSFAYGALPLIVTDLVAEGLNRLPWTDDRNWHGYDHLYRVGRFLSALFDTATVLVVFALGARIANRRVGLLAAVVVALAPMSIQLAHFFTTDSWLTFFVALCLLWSIRAAERGELRWFAAAGVAYGLAMATKGSVFTLGGVLALTVFYDVWRRRRFGERLVEALTAVPERVAIAGISALAAFAVFEPYALARPRVYRSSLEEQANIVRGLIDVPFTRQYIGTTPVVYHLEQLIRWGFGPVAGVLALLGLLPLVRRVLRRPRAGEVLVLAWLLGYGLVIALPETKFLRYLAPLVPALAVTAGLALDACWRLIARVSHRLATGVLAAALVGMALWTAAFTSIYAQENTRLAASTWIYANIPSGSTLGAESVWDDALPKDLAPGLTPWDRQYETVFLDLYHDFVPDRDLQIFATALASHAPTLPAAEALRSRDAATASTSLRSLATRILGVAPDTRNSLATSLDLAAADMSGASNLLRDAARATAATLRDDVEQAPAQLQQLATALSETAENETANAIYRKLEQVDYFVMSSNRVSTGITNNPWRYPVQIQFYQLMAREQLGFTLVAEFTRFPGLGGFTISDDSADESFLNYDHPHVWIYRKDSLVGLPEYQAQMAEARARPVVQTRWPPEDLMLDDLVGDLPVVNDARWSARITDHSAVALIVWVAMLGILQLLGWPLACLLFGRFADAGWGFSRLLVLVLGGYVVWIGASLQIFAFRAVWAWTALFALAVIAWSLRLRMFGGWSAWRIWPIQRRTALGGEVVFWGVFALFLLFRYLNPDSWHPFWGGEKPMEFAHLNATLRSAHFPPYDPWFAGGYINYYYYGLYLVAFCIKLTGIPSEIAFNLAQPTIIALLAAAGYSLAATLGHDLTRRARTAIPAGVLGVLLLIGIGNLDAFFRWLARPEGRVYEFGYWTWDPSRAISGAITEFPYFTALYADLHAHVVALPITVLALTLSYSLARDRHRLALALAEPRRSRHALVVSVARLAVLMITIGSLSATNAWDVPTYGALGAVALWMATGAILPWWRRTMVWAGASGVLALGAYLLFLPFFTHYVALFGSLGEVRAPTDLWEFGSHLGGLLAIAAIGLVAILVRRGAFNKPTEQNETIATLLAQPLVPVMLLALALAGRSLLADRPGLETALTAVVVVVPAVTLLAASWRQIGGYGGRSLAAAALFGGLGVAALAAALAVATERYVLGLLLALATAATVAWLLGKGTAVRFVGLLVVTAAAIGAGTEIVFLVDDLESTEAYRMNTIFKFYNQLWVLLALAGAALVARMIHESGIGADRGGLRPRGLGDRLSGLGILPTSGITRPEPPANPKPVQPFVPLSPSVGWSRTGLIVAGLVVFLSLFYPALATRPRLDQRFSDTLGSGTLNALDWMTYGTLPVEDAPPDGPFQISFADDRAAIDWLNAEVPGSPVIAEASFGPYRCNGSRFAIATGLPTIIGWKRHLSQQRFPDGLDERERDVRTLYVSADPEVKLEILRRYDVAYVVVGDLERLYPQISGNDCVANGSVAGITALEGMVGSSLEVAFQQGGTTVYRVLPATPPTNQ